MREISVMQWGRQGKKRNLIWKKKSHEAEISTGERKLPRIDIYEYERHGLKSIFIYPISRELLIKYSHD